MIFKIHFFIYGLSLSTIYISLYVYAKHYAKKSEIEYGEFAMILPFLSLIAKPVVCSMADTYRAHRLFLAGTMGCYLVGFGGLAILPFFLSDDLDVAWIFIRILITLGYVSAGALFSLTDALSANYAQKNKTSYSFIRIWGTLGWGGGGLMLMLIKIESAKKFVPGLLLLILVSIVDILIIALWTNKDDFTMTRGESVTDPSEVNTNNGKNNTSTTKSVSSDISDKNRLEMQGSTKNINHEENIIKTDELDDTNQLSNLRIQLILLKMIAWKHKSLIRFLILFVVYGLVQSCIWNFEFGYFEKKITHNDEEFASMTSMSLLAQSICGEAIIYILAPKMMEIYGLNANMTLTLLAIGMRCFLYANFLPHVNHNFVILTESLQGPSFGLFYCVQNAAGLKYSLMVNEFIPKLRKRGIVTDANEEYTRGCLRATMTGLMGACMEGLGVGVGVYVAGVICNKFDYYVLWNTGAAVGFSAAIINLVIDLIPKRFGQTHSSIDITKTSINIEDITATNNNNSNNNNNNNNNNNSNNNNHDSENYLLTKNKNTKLDIEFTPTTNTNTNTHNF